jgi:hypothetical protein
MTDRERIDPATDEQLSALVDGELGADEERALRARVAAEPELARRLAALEAVDARLRALPAPALPRDLRARLQARIDAEPAAALVKRPSRIGAAVGLALAAGLAATLYLASPRAPHEPSEPADRLPRIANAPRSAASDEIDLDDGGSAVPSRGEPLAAAPEPSNAELAIAFELDALRDFDLIDQLELLEALAAEGEDAG